MRTSLSLLLAALCFSFMARAQNLVPNPSFEDKNVCPSTFGQINTNPPSAAWPSSVADWYSVLFNSPDYYNSCTTDIYATVPQNFHGYQMPRTGDAYVGLAYSAGPDGNFRGPNTYQEYIICKLNAPMIAGAIYDVYYHVNLIQRSDMCGYMNAVAFRELGAHFSTTNLSGTSNPVTILSLPYVPLTEAGNAYLDDSVNWIKVHNIYTATGGEQWMVIGSFHNTSTPPDMKNMCGGAVYPGVGYSTYFLIDDVGVYPHVECDTTTAVHDTLYCAGAAPGVTLKATRTGDSYQWSTGETTAAVTLGEGVYWCEIRQGCSLHTDTFKIREKVPVSLELGADKKICNGLPFTLGTPMAGMQYLWNTGSTECCIDPTTSGMYSLQIGDGCTTATDSVQVDFVRCKDCVLLPSAFSPNADGLNDRFGPIINCDISNYMVQVFNRWGERVFLSYRKEQRWDGMYRGALSPVGTYYCVLEFVSPAGKREQIKGDITLVR